MNLKILTLIDLTYQHNYTIPYFAVVAYDLYVDEVFSFYFYLNIVVLFLLNKRSGKLNEIIGNHFFIQTYNANIQRILSFSNFFSNYFQKLFSSNSHLRDFDYEKVILMVQHHFY